MGLDNSEAIMAKFLDTEGAEIPDSDGGPLFDADMCDWTDGRGPTIAMRVPHYFATDSGEYDSQGVLSLPVKDLLEEYLRDFSGIDDGEGIEEFSAWLHDYADRLLTEKARLKGTPSASPSTAPPDSKGCPDQ
jgi:hypothetical protein